MASPSELSFDCKPHSYSLLLQSLGDQTDNTHKLEEFLSRLEEEKLKVDAFKRELPLCMQLLSNAVEASRQQLQTSRGNQGGSMPKLEEFIPIKNASPCEAADKATWMNTAQLWSQSGNNETTPNNNIIPLRNTSPQATDVIGFNARPKLGLDNKQRNGEAFLPFSKERNSLRPSPTLALSTVDKENIMEDKNCSKGTYDQQVKGDRMNKISSTNVTDGQEGNTVNSNNINCNSTITTSANNSDGSNTSNGQSRKARRCWSPDLHRRFVNALRMLGGSQVATPKQIRELMKVDGLTNDEVKSHLQKYRLHTRRPGPNPQAAVAPTSHLVVLGGIWIPPEYAAAHGGAPTLYGAHHHTASGPRAAHVPPPNFCSPPPPVTQNFYTEAVPPHHSLHYMYKAAPQPDCRSSPESDDQRSGDCSESIDKGCPTRAPVGRGRTAEGEEGLLL